MKKLIYLIAFTVGISAFASETPSLQIKEGSFIRNGQVYRGMGINYFDAFIRVLRSAKTDGGPIDDSYRKGFATLQSYDIPFIRFVCGGYYPADMALYQKDPKRYFQLLDQFVADAEKSKLGLIPSLFWFSYTVPAIVGEPRSAWGDPTSKTIAFMRRYVSDVVGRYKDSSAIWGWEFGNEFHLHADLAIDLKNTPGFFNPIFGMPAKRTEFDKLTAENIRTAFREFALAVRKIDLARPIFTGDAMPRSSAHNLEKSGSWTKDSEGEWLGVLKKNNPDPIDTVSIHFYLPEPGKKSDYGITGRSMEERLQVCLRVSSEIGKPLWVGEFGPSEVGDEVSQSQFQEVYEMILRNNVPLSAVWVFDFAGQPHLTITADNERKDRLEAVRKANERFRLVSP